MYRACHIAYIISVVVKKRFINGMVGSDDDSMLIVLHMLLGNCGLFLCLWPFGGAVSCENGLYYCQQKGTQRPGTHPHKNDRTNKEVY